MEAALEAAGREAAEGMEASAEVGSGDAVLVCSDVTSQLVGLQLQQGLRQGHRNDPGQTGGGQRW